MNQLAMKRYYTRLSMQMYAVEMDNGFLAASKIDPFGDSIDSGRSKSSKKGGFCGIIDKCKSWNKF